MLPRQFADNRIYDISREIKRNSVNGKYLAHIANEKYINNKINCGAKSKLNNNELV